MAGGATETKSMSRRTVSVVPGESRKRERQGNGRSLSTGVSRCVEERLEEVPNGVYSVRVVSERPCGINFNVDRSAHATECGN